MKANAPEKLYLSKNIYSTYQYQVPDHDDDTAVEYTKTDAFIEKAAKFLDDNLYTYDNSSGRGLWTEVIADTGFNTVEEFIENFRKYMKGE